jgi:predicted NUDIX family phosphoesterase
MAKKQIEIKGTINVDKKEMSKVHAGGTCASASTGILCRNYVPNPKQELLRFGVLVDTLIP